MTIQTKLAVAFSLSITLPLVLLGLVSYFVASKTVRDLAIESNRRILQQINRSIDANVQEIERISRSVYSSDQAQSALIGICTAESGREPISQRMVLKDVLIGMITTRDDFSGIYLFPLVPVGTDGPRPVVTPGESHQIAEPVYVRKGWAMDPAYALVDEPWLPAVLNSHGEALVVGAHKEPQPLRNPETVFSLVRLVRGVESGHPLGVLVMNIRLDVIRRICSGSNIYPDTEIILFGPQGRVTYHRDDARIGTIPSPDDPLQSVESEQWVQFPEGPALVSVNSSNLTGFSAYSVIPSSELNRGSNFIRWTTLLVVLVGAAASIVISRSLSSHIIQPIRDLQGLMKTVEEGNFQVHVPIERHDEVGQLARGFDFMMRQINNLVSTVYAAQIKNQEAQLEVLQSKINPHFLYNTLDVIRGMALAGRSNEVVDVAESLAHLFRYAMSSGGDLVALDEELSYIRRYLLVQHYRFGRRLSYDVEAGPGTGGILVPRLMLQPLVENSIYHGVEQVSGAGRITVQSERVTVGNRSDVVQVTVADNGPGVPDDRLAIIAEALRTESSRFPQGFAVRSGVGLLNVHGRLRIRFGEPAGLSVANGKGGGFVVTAQIPAVPEPESQRDTRASENGGTDGNGSDR